MATEKEVQDAEKAEKADDKEDADYKEQAKPGHQSDEGYIKDDAQKAEAADDNEDQQYADKQDVLAELDGRYASKKDHDGLTGIVQDLQRKVNEMYGAKSQQQAQHDTVNLDTDLEQK